MGSRMISCLLASRTVASNTGGIGDGYPKKIQPCGENRMKRKKMWAAITLVSGLLRYSKSNVQEQELQGFDLVVSMVVVCDIVIFEMQSGRLVANGEYLLDGWGWLEGLLFWEFRRSWSVEY